MFLNKISFLNKKIKLGIIITNDLFICLISTILIFKLIEDKLLTFNYIEPITFGLANFLILVSIFFYKGSYKSIIRYFNIVDVLELFKGLVLFYLVSISFFIIINIIGIIKFNLIALIVIPFVISIFIFSSRLLVISTVLINSQIKKRKVLIYGAGEAGVQAVSTLNLYKNYEIVAFIDDDKSKIGRSISGISIHPSTKISYLINQFSVTEMYVAIPSLSNLRRKEIISKMQNIGIKTKILPQLNKIIDGKVNFVDFNFPKLNDLIDRNIHFKENEISRLISANSILISGAGGSIGSELSRQIVKNRPSHIILLEQSELNLFNINNELKAYLQNNKIENCNIKLKLGSINNNSLVEEIFEKYKPKIIYHAAAYKHVSLIEENVFSGIENNIFGTINLIKYAIKSKSVEKFMMISTDKAVRPTSVMGMTKRVAEMYIQSLQDLKNSSIKFSIVRFGNVLGSSGSVVPIFYKQIENGGPITVTDREVTRFIMSIEEAVGLILTASFLSKGNEIYLLDMGEPIKILDLAKKIVNLSGLKIKDNQNPNGDIEIIFTGLKPGEKLYEELLVDGNSKKTQFDYIYRAVELSHSNAKMNQYLAQINDLFEKKDKGEILKLLKSIIKIDNDKLIEVDN